MKKNLKRVKPSKKVVVFVAFFALLGLIVLFVSKASSGTFSSEIETALLGNSATKLNDQNASGGSYVQFGGSATQPIGGIVLSYGGQQSLAYNTFVQSAQVPMQWNQIEPSRGTFCWNNPQTDLTKTGCGTSPTNGLTQLLKNLHDNNKTAIVQIQARVKPQWVYSARSGVTYCGTAGDPIFPNNQFDIPQYWTTNGTLNEAYFTIMQEMLDSFKQAIQSSGYQSTVEGIRVAPQLIGSEFRDLTSNLYAVQLTPACQSWAWNTDLADQAYARTMKMNYNTFQPNIRTILRATAFNGLNRNGHNYNLDPNTYLTVQPGKVQSWFFATSSNPDADYENKNSQVYSLVRNSGKAIYYSDAVDASVNQNHNTPINSPVSWNYWNQLTNLDRGSSYITSWGADLQLALTNPEYRAAYDFTNIYAGYNRPQMATTSPGAWVAFAPGTPGDRSITHGNFSMFMAEDTADGSVGLDSFGAPATGKKCFLGMNDGTGKCPGVNIIGDKAQRFGRWARRTDLANGKPTIRVSLDDSFKSSLPDIVKINLTYLDYGIGAITFDWGGGNTKINKSNTNQWKTVSLTIKKDQINRKVAGFDFGITSTGTDATLHMLEVRR